MSNTIELTVHTSCYLGLRLTVCYRNNAKYGSDRTAFFLFLPSAYLTGIQMFWYLGVSMQIITTPLKLNLIKKLLIYF